MFKISFTVSTSRLEKLLETVEEVGFADYDIEFQRPTTDRKPQTMSARRDPHKTQQKKRATDSQILSLTTKKTRPGTKRAELPEALEKLEAKHGVGKVTRKMLRDKCTELGIDHQVIYKLLREGYLKSD